MMRADMATVVTARGGVRGGRNEQSGRIFAPLLIPFLILAAIAVYAALAPYAKTNVPPPGAHGSLVWGGAIFANELEMKAWLRLHGGGSFQGWAKAHPAALRLVKPARHHHHTALVTERRKPAHVRKVS